MNDVLKHNKIFDFFKKHKLSYLISIAIMLLASFVLTLTPKILGKTIDIMKTEGFDRNLVIQNIGYLVLATVSAFLLAYTWRHIFVANSRKMECSLREDLYRHFQILSPNFYSNRKTGDLIAYAVNDIAAVRTAFGPAIAIALSGLVICIYSVYSMAANINLLLTLLSLIPIPPLVVFIVVTGQRIQDYFKEVQKNYANISDKVQENISGIRVIKAYVQERQEIESFESLNGKMRNSNLRLVRISALIAPAIETCFGISFAISLIFGYRMVVNGRISLGDFVSFNSYLTMIVRPITIIGKVIKNLQMGTASAKRLNELFSAQPDIKSPPNAVTRDIIGGLELKNVSFSYNGTSDRALENISLKIEPGQTIGITGQTGSGKSTLMDILIRCYDPNSGEVLMDGRNLKDYSLDTVKEAFGFVPQESFLFSSTIRENITFFRDVYSENEIIDAACCSNIYDTIQKMPKGLDTVIGERGVNLSGGQQQRLAIARAVIKNSPILILDDALSAVDADTEEIIVKNLRKIRCGKTTIIISHRLSALSNTDVIAVMENGRIIEKGSQSELLAERGKYYEIHKEQNQ